MSRKHRPSKADRQPVTRRYMARLVGRAVQEIKATIVTSERLALLDEEPKARRVRSVLTSIHVTSGHRNPFAECAVEPCPSLREDILGAIEPNVEPVSDDRWRSLFSPQSRTDA